MNSTSKTSSGIGPGFLLFLVFLTLKLCAVIDWSWWWVTAPLWIPLLVVVLVFLTAVVVSMLRASRKAKEAT